MVVCAVVGDHAQLGAALLYGDGVITPAISILSVVEGIDVVTDAFKHNVLPATLVTLFVLFAVQSCQWL